MEVVVADFNGLTLSINDLAALSLLSITEHVLRKSYHCTFGRKNFQ